MQGRLEITAPQRAHDVAVCDSLMWWQHSEHHDHERYASSVAQQVEDAMTSITLADRSMDAPRHFTLAGDCEVPLPPREVVTIGRGGRSAA